MKTLTVVILIISFNVLASDVIFTSSDNITLSYEISTTESNINCNGIDVNVTDPTVSHIKFISSSQLCPRVLIDNLVYEGDITVRVFHVNKLIVIEDLIISNCVNGEGNPPTIGFNFIMSAGTLTSGVSKIEVDESQWIIKITTLDENVVCDGGVPPISDVIFKTGFEVEQNKLKAGDANEIPIESGSDVIIDLDGNLIIESSLTGDEIVQELGIDPPESNINSFTGPNGCTDCTVNANTSFDMFWDVENVSSCTGSNSAGVNSFNGTLEPFGGGSGAFQTTITGGLPIDSGTITFTLNCPGNSISEFEFKYLGEESRSFKLSKDKRMIIHNEGVVMTLINLIEDRNHVYSNDKNMAATPISENVYLSNVIIKEISDINSKFNLTLTNKSNHKTSANDLIWFYISENDPEKTNTKPYPVGRCDVLGNNTQLNLSTFDLSKEVSQLNHICSLESGRTYYLNKVYLHRFNDIEKALKIIEKGREK